MPIIGVPLRYDYSNDEGLPILHIYESVRTTIQKAGGELFMLVPNQDVNYMKTSYKDIPPLTDKEKKEIESNIDKCDGLFLPGGIKFTPFDDYIIEYAIKKNIPTLAVCLSMQMMSCHNEEVKLNDVEDLDMHYQPFKKYSHSVIIDKNSKLYDILKKDKIEVNSMHKHCAIENHIYRVIARSTDGIIEGLEHPTCTFNIGIQWHPEKTYNEDINSKLIIDAFINEARKYSETK